MMYSYEDIRTIHIEPTTRCNAACPMCARNARGITAPGLRLTELSVEDFRAIFSENFIKQLESVIFCGSYGDPALSQDLIDIIKYVRTANTDCAIRMYTNGGIRSTDWWKSMAEALGSNGSVVFAIDGLEDTNAIYRRGVDFKKVIANAEAFIVAGGGARWDFLAFRHNEHQIESAELLSKKFGFNGFKVKKTNRFIDAIFDSIPEFEDNEDFSKFPIYSKDGDVVDYLQPVSDSKWTKESAANYAAALYEQDALEVSLAQTPIRCKVKDLNSIFVSAQGHAFPCPWTYVQATRPLQSELPSAANWDVWELLKSSGGFEGIDAVKLGLEAVIEGPFFSAIESGWSCESLNDGRLRVCARVCGTKLVEFDSFEDHKKNGSLQLHQDMLDRAPASNA